MTDFNLDQYTDNDKLDLIERENWEHERKQMANQLHIDLAMPLPEDPEGKKEALRRRGTSFDNLRVLNHKLTPQDLPLLQKAPSRDDTDNYDPEFLIDNWMPADRLTMLVGPGGTGKSYLALQHIAGLAQGINCFLKPYHGKLDDLWADTSGNAFPKDPIKIVIASYEEDLQETWKRLAWVSDALGWVDYDKLTKQIQFVDLKMFGPIWGVNDDKHLATRSKLLDVGQWLFDQCEACDARLLMLDPSAGAFGGSEIARESVREFCSHLNGWGQSANCATLLIAHPNKAGEYSGSTDWLGSCRAMWTLGIEQENIGTKTTPEWVYWYQLTNVKQNYAAPQREIYLQKIQTQEGHFTPIWQRCQREDAIDFFNQYHNSGNAPQKEDTEDDDTDSDPYTVEFK